MTYAPTVFTDFEEPEFNAAEANKLGTGVQTAQADAELALAAARSTTAAFTVGRKYALMTGANQGYADTVDRAATHLTTVADMRALVYLANWATGTNQFLIGKASFGANQRSYWFSVAGTGELQAFFSHDGTTVLTMPKADSTMPALLGIFGAPVWVRAKLLSDDGTGKSSVTYYYSLDNAATWIQIGAAKTNVTPGPFFSGTGVITAGVQNNGTSQPITAGRLYVTEIWDGTPTLISRLDVRALANSSSTYTDTVGTAGSVYSPMAGVALFADKINYLDVDDRALEIVKIAPDQTGATVTTTFNVKDGFGAKGDGVTDDSTAIALASIVAGLVGGIVYYPPGTYIAENISLQSNVKHVGAGQSATIIKLKAGSTHHLFTASNSAWFGVSSNASDGENNFGFFDLTLDGNKTNAPAGGNGLNVFGYFYRLERVAIRNFHGWGWWAEWGSNSGAPGTGEVRHFVGFRVDIHGCDGGGMKNLGPGDSSLYFSEIHNNLGIGFDNEPWSNYNGDGLTKTAGGAGVHLVSCHVYGHGGGPSHDYGVLMNAGGFLVDLYSEQALYADLVVGESNVQYTGGKIFNSAQNLTVGGGGGIWLQNDPTGSAPTGFQMSNVYLVNLPSGAFNIKQSGGGHVIKGIRMFDGHETTTVGAQTGMSGSWTLTVADATALPTNPGRLIVNGTELTYTAVPSPTTLTVQGGNGVAFPSGAVVSHGSLYYSGSAKFGTTDNVDVYRTGGSVGADSINQYAATHAALTVPRGVQMTEQAVVPATPAANGGVLFMQDNGAGKTQLCVKWDSGAVSVLATEP